MEQLSPKDIKFTSGMNPTGKSLYEVNYEIPKLESEDPAKTGIIVLDFTRKQIENNFWQAKKSNGEIIGSGLLLLNMNTPDAIQNGIASLLNENNKKKT